MSLDTKRLLISGVVNRESIAYAVAEKALAGGARIALTAFPRDRALTEQAAESLGGEVAVYELDVTDVARYAWLEEELGSSLGGIDGVLHAVAFSPLEALAGRMADASPAAVELAFRTSSYSLAPMSELCANLAGPGGGSVVALGFDSERAWPVYNWMGVCKAALDASARYLARDLGPRGVRVNVVAAGPLHTRAASGIPGFEKLLAAWESGSPLPWDPSDPAPVADTVCFLLSDSARAISGEVIHVDGGFHSVAALGVGAAAEPGPSTRHVPTRVA